MADNYRCARCETEYLKGIAKKTGRSRNVFVDMSRAISRCKIPRFTHNFYGVPVVIYWDCKNQVEVVYSQKEYERKRARGEL